MRCRYRVVTQSLMSWPCLCPSGAHAEAAPGVAGSINGRALRGRGVLLDHRAAASAIEEARELARVRVQIRHIRDWVVDYSEPGAVWIVSDWAWYRCAAQGPQTLSARQQELSDTSLGTLKGSS